MNSKIAAVSSLVLVGLCKADAEDAVVGKGEYVKWVREGVRSPVEAKRFAVADDLRFFNYRAADWEIREAAGTPRENWAFTEEIRTLLKDKVLRVRTQALIALSSCASFIPRDEAAELAKELRGAIERNDPEIDLPDPSPPLEKKFSIEESSTIFLALASLYTENVIISAKDADWFETYDLVPAMAKLAEENLESEERLRWVFFMMFAELRGTNNRVIFLPRFRKMALSGSPELFGDAWRVLERLQGLDPITWSKWIRQLYRNEERVLEIERDVHAKKKKLKALNPSNLDDQLIDLNNFIAFLNLTRNEFYRLGLDAAEQGGADQSATAPKSKSEITRNPKPESEGRPQ